MLTVEFTVLGIPCLGLNGGPAFKHSEAFSFQILTEDQAETDRYWNAIVNNGGTESQCGWCKDRWGLSWQITPRVSWKRRPILIERRQAGVRCDDGNAEDRHCRDRGGTARQRSPLTLEAIPAGRHQCVAGLRLVSRHTIAGIGLVRVGSQCCGRTVEAKRPWIVRARHRAQSALRATHLNHPQGRSGAKPGKSGFPEGDGREAATTACGQPYRPPTA